MKSNQQSLSKDILSKLTLIIVDMQEGFRKQAEEMGIIPRLQKLTEFFHENKIPIIWTQHGHLNLENDGGQLARWWGKEDCIMHGSEKWKIVKELSPRENDYIVSLKVHYDAFRGTELLTYLRSIGTETLIVSGALTNLCCEDTARSAFNFDFEVFFLEDGTAASTAEMHQASLLNLRYGYAKIFTVDKLIEWINTIKDQELLIQSAKIEIKEDELEVKIEQPTK